MSTNFYVKTGKKVKKICNLGEEHEVDEVLHIGLSNFGWKFCLHIIPEIGIAELKDWIPVLKAGEIVDEYDKPISFDDMMWIINHPVVSQCRMDKHDGCILDDDGLWYSRGDKIGEGKSYCLVNGEFC